MGIVNSRLDALIQPPASLKWKAGIKNETIPCPPVFNSLSFDKLFARVDFKDYICINLDSDYLISAILDNAHDDKTLTSGITFFQSLDPDLRKISSESLETFRRVTLAGIEVKLSDTLEIFEREMHSRSDTRSSPFMKSFQRRLAVLRGLDRSIAEERSIAQSPRAGREYAEAPLSSKTLPQLHLLDWFENSGLAFLRVFPMCYTVVPLQNQKDLLIDPVLKLCHDISAVEDLVMFSTWSPPQRVVEKKVQLVSSSGKASSGDAVKALDGLAHTHWVSSGPKATFSVELASPCSILSIRITWSLPSGSVAPLPAGSAASGPPKVLTILTKSATGNKFEIVRSVDCDCDLRKPSSQTVVSYPLVASDVSAIQLVMSNPSESNQLIKIFNIEAFAPDSDAKWVDTLSILRNLQSALFPLHHIYEVSSSLYRTLVSIVRITGSLGLALHLVKFIHENNLEHMLKSNAVDAVLDLLKFIHKEDLSVRQEILNSRINVERILSDVVFDATAKSAEVDIFEGGMMAGSKDIGTNAYAMLNCVMDSGVWEWEMTLVQDDHGDETTCMGLSKRPMLNCDYASSSDLWMVRCYNGEPYHAGRLGNRRAVSHIHPNDICRFTFDAEARTVSLCINDVDQGIIFERVPKGVSPAVVFYGSHKTVRLLSVKRRGGSQTALPSDLMPPTDPPSAALLEGQESLTTLILGMIANLAKTRALALECDNRGTPSRSLEYPFCIQVSSAVLAQMLDLLQWCTKGNNSSARSVEDALSILQILDAQFSCLTLSEIDPIHAGFATSPKSAPDKLLSVFSSVLNSLMASSEPKICIAAARVFARGVRLFLPNTCERLELALILVTNTEAGEEDAKVILLKMLMKQLSRCEEVLKILILYTEESQWRSNIFKFVSELIISLCHYSQNVISGTMQAPLSKSFTLFNDADFRASACEFLWKFQEQLLYEVITHVPVPPTLAATLAAQEHLLVRYCAQLCVSCTGVLTASCATSNTSPQSAFRISAFSESAVKDSLVSMLLSPLIHGLCLCANRSLLMHALLPHMVRLMKELSSVCAQSADCKLAIKLIGDSIQRPLQQPGSASLFKGWRQIRTAFEDTDPSYQISDNGMLYTAVHSSNTCALVPMGFSSPTRAAWEFCLEADTANDECSVFGAAQMPLTSRCYSSSPDLWMRRAYNGYMYARGRTTGNTTEKIHPGDIIRVEFDGRAGTLSFGVNGAEPEVAFSDITGEIFPACGSYRSAVQIRLLKVEVYGGSSGVDAEESAGQSPLVAHWVVDDELSTSRDQSTLTPSKLLGKDDEEKDPEKKRTWVTARADIGASDGVHEFAFELLERSKVPLVFGIVIGGDPYPRDRLAGECLVDVRDPYWSASIAGDIGSERLDREPVSAVITESPGFGDALSRSAVVTPTAPTVASTRSASPLVSTSSSTIAPAASFASVDEGESEEAPIADGVYIPPTSEFPPLTPSPTTVARRSDAWRQVTAYSDDARRASRSSPRRSPTRQNMFAAAIEGLAAMSTRSVARTRARAMSDNIIAVRVDSGGVSKQTGQKQEPPRKAVFSYQQKGVLAMAWSTDGSLWVNGEKRADGFGKQALPLDKYSSVVVRINRIERTVCFLVNGVYVGTAFGPAGSNAVVCHPLPEVRISERVSSHQFSIDTVYPAASVSSHAQSLRIRPAGFHGSIVIPKLLFIQKTTASTIGRICAALLTGPEVDKREKLLIPWLQSSLLIGGLDDTMQSHVRGPVRTWSHLWSSVDDALTREDADLEPGDHSQASSTKLKPLSGELNVKVYRAEALKLRGDCSGDPWVRLRVEKGGVTQDSTCTAPHVGGGSYPVWDPEGSLTLRFNCPQEEQVEGGANAPVLSAPSQLPLVFAAEVVCINGHGEEEVLGSATVDMLDMWNTSSTGCLALKPQGVLQVEVVLTGWTFAKSSSTVAASTLVENEDPEGGEAQLAKSSSPTATTSSTASADIIENAREIDKDAVEHVSIDDKILSVFLSDVLDSNVDSADSAGMTLLNWLENIDADPIFLRKALEKTGSFRFSRCELSLVACLLKHGKLVPEAYSALRALSRGEKPASPSADMVSLWKRVKQVRTLLRTQKQRFKASDNPTATDNSTDAEIGKQDDQIANSSVRVENALEVESKSEDIVFTTADAQGTSFEESKWEDIHSRSESNPTRRVALESVEFPAVDGSYEYVEISNSMDSAVGLESEPVPEAQVAVSATRVLDSPVTEPVSGVSLSLSPFEVAFPVVSRVDPIGIASGAVEGVDARRVASIHESTETMDLDTDMEHLLEPENPVEVAEDDGILGALISYDAAFISHGRVAWRSQPSGTQSRYNASYHCTVSAVGIDFLDKLVYVRYSVVGDSSLGPLQSPLTSKLTLDTSVFSVSLSRFDIQDSQSHFQGCLRYDLVDFDSSRLSYVTATFEYGEGGYSSVALSLPIPSDVQGTGSMSNDVEADLENGSLKDPASFEDLCDRIMSRARFLLKIVPVGHVGDDESLQKSKAFLQHRLGLDNGSVVDASVGNGSIPPVKVARWRSEDGRDRWKRVVDFLRVHSRIRKQLSSSTQPGDSQAQDELLSRFRPLKRHISSQDSFRLVDKLSARAEDNAISDNDIETVDDDEEDDMENMSPTQSSMQACLVFITTAAFSSPMDKLQEIMERRSIRSQFRCVAMHALCELLNQTDISSDFFAVEEVLLFIRQSFLSTGVKPIDDEGKVGQGVHRDQERAHYLSCLEGASCKSLLNVQSAFTELYSATSELLGEYIAIWHGQQPMKSQQNTALVEVGSVQSSLMDTAIVHRENNHLNTVVGPMRILMSLWGLHFSTRDHLFLYECGVLKSLHALTSLETFESAAKTWMDAAFEFLDFYQKHSVILSPVKLSWKPWASSYVQENLRNSTLSCRTVLLHLLRIPADVVSEEEKKSLGLVGDIRSLCAKYDVTAVSLLYEKVLQCIKRKELTKFKESERRRLAEETAKSKLEEERKAWLQSHGVPLFGSSAENKSDDIILEDADQIAYLRSPRSPDFKVACVFCTVTYDASRCTSETGNYFEVEILDASQKDIGVGLAAHGLFPVQGDMPGWDTNSFGYHGDDGKKFGFGNTPGTWPKWNVGDVIGCGIDHDRKVIFYSLNGSLLGDAFTEVNLTKLTPVVGFHSSAGPQKIRVNFGVVPFRYEEAGVVVVHPSAMEERQRVLRGPLVLGPDDPADLLHIGGSSEEKEEGIQIEEKSAEEDVFTDLKPKTMPLTIEDCQATLIALEAKLNSASRHLSELSSLRGYAGSIMKFLMTITFPGVVKQGEDVGDPDFPKWPLFGPLKKQRMVSSYGTPIHSGGIQDNQTKQLQEWVIGCILEELTIGARYLKRHSAGYSVVSGKPGEPVGNNCTLSSPPPLPSPPNDSASTTGSILLPDEGAPAGSSPSAGEGEGLIASTGTGTVHVFEPEKVSDDKSDDHMSASQENGIQLEIVTLEPLEVESILFDHMFLLNSLVSANHLLKDELCTRKALEAFFLLHHTGSPRLQQATSNLLCTCLPSVIPEEAELATPASWRDPVYSDVMVPPSTVPTSSRRRIRRRPDSIVRALMSGVQNSIRSASEDCWKRVLSTETIFTHADNEVSARGFTAFGQGLVTLKNADSYTHLLQQLFKAPMWMEIVASNITDALRNAAQVVSTLAVTMPMTGAELPTLSTMLSQEQISDLEIACAACAVLGGLGLLRPGTRVHTSQGMTGVFVSAVESDAEKTVEIALSEHVSKANALSNILTMDSTNVFPDREGISFDISTLSQPLLPQLISLIKQLLICFKRLHSQMTSVTPAETTKNAVYALLWRLNHFSFTALAFLLDKQPDAVIDATHDADLVRDLLAASLLPIGLNFFTSLADTSRMWAAVQARVLELNESPQLPLDAPTLTEAAVIARSAKAVTRNKTSNLKPSDPAPVVPDGSTFYDESISFEDFKDDSPMERGEGCVPAAMVGTPTSSTPGVGEEREVGTLQDVREAPVAHSPAIDADGSAPAMGGFGSSTLAVDENPVCSEVEAFVNRKSLQPVLFEKQNLVLYSKADRLKRRAVVALLAAEADVSQELAAVALEYFMCDFNAAKCSLSSGGVSLESFMDTASTTFVNKIEFSDGNVLRHIDNQGMQELLAGPSVLFNQPYACSTERLLATNEDGTGRGHLLEVGSVLCQSQDEGPTPIPGTRIGSSMCSGLLSPGDVIVAYASKELGVSTCCSLPVESLRIAKQFFDRSSRQLPTLLQSLDASAAIMRMRQIASKFVLQANIQRWDDLKAIEDIVLLLKLISASRWEDYEAGAYAARDSLESSVMFNVCSTLFSRVEKAMSLADKGRDEVDSEKSSAKAFTDRMIDALIDNVTRSFSQLTLTPVSVSTNSGKGDDINDTKSSEDEEEIVCSSTHPFSSPHKCHGAIPIPSHWKGVVVSFNPKCSTPSELSTLKFYKSARDYTDSKPSHVFWGEAGGQSAHSFNSIMFTGVETIYYGFDARVGADKPPLMVVALDGSLKVGLTGVIEVATCDSKDAVGLGEEDTLFNLFNSKAPDSTGGHVTAVTDCPCMREGTWFFEVGVVAVAAGEDEATLARARIGLVGASFKGFGALEMWHLSAFDPDSSMWYLSADGMAYGGSSSEATKSLGVWAVGDTLGCLFHFEGDEAIVWFGRNGSWSAPLKGHVEEGGLRPVFAIVGNFRLQPNFGEGDFRFPISHSRYKDAWLPLLSRPSTTPLSTNWGYQFRVQPLKDLSVRVARDFELIWKSPSTEGDSKDATVECSIWRPKTTFDFMGTGDIFSKAITPPRGAIIVDKQQCKPPTSFKKVFSNAKLGIVVWRPVPPIGFVSLGDIVSVPFTAGTPATSTCLCVPLWAVRECSVGMRVLSKRSGDSKSPAVSLWAIQNSLGTFFGSASDQRTVAGKADDSVPETGYCLRLPRVQCMISGEWSDESDILSSPSLSWTCSLLHIMLSHPMTRHRTLSAMMFSVLVKYLRSHAAPSPLAVIPLLIRMIRLANADNIDLGLSQIEGLCSTVLASAVSRVQADKTVQLPEALLGLVDLAVEVQAASLSTQRTAAVKGASDFISSPSFEGAEESKVEIDVVESKDDTVPMGSIQSSISQGSFVMGTSVTENWWDRSSVTASQRTAARLVDIKQIFKDNDEAFMLFFSKEQVLPRLRFVLDFLYSVENSQRVESLALSSSAPCLMCALPQYMVAHIWYNHASLCSFEESDHPHTKTSWSKTVSFPGADKLTVTLDRRCALAAGAVLRVCGGGMKWEFRDRDEERWTKSLVITGSKVDITLDTSQMNENELMQEWGWALVVGAEGPVYEVDSTDIQLPSVQSLSYMTQGLSTEITSAADTAGVGVPDCVVEANVDDSALFDGLQLAARTDVEYSLLPESDHPPAPPPPPRPSTKKSQMTPLSSASTPTHRTNQLSDASMALSSGYADDLSTLTSVVSYGLLVSSGRLCVPLAPQLEVTISRPRPATTQSEVVFAVALTYKTSKGADILKQKTELVGLKDQGGRISKHNIFVEDGTVNYAVYAICASQLRSLDDRVESNAAEAKGGRSQQEGKTCEALAVVSDDKEITQDAAVGAVDEVSNRPVHESEARLPEVLVAEGKTEAEAEAEAEEGSTATAPFTSPGPVEPEPSPPALPFEWVCPRCTFFNPIEVACCRMCDLPNPDTNDVDGAGTAGAADSSDMEDGEASALSGAGWWCARCTFINALSRTTCQICDFANGVTNDETTPPAAGVPSRDQPSRPSRRPDVDRTHEDKAVDAPVEAKPVSDEKPKSSSGSGAEEVNDVVGGTNKEDVLTISVKGILTDALRYESRLEACIKDDRWTPAILQRCLGNWGRSSDSVLLEYIDTMASVPASKSLLSSPIFLALSRHLLTYRGLTQDQSSLLSVQCRALLFDLFNSNLEELLPIINLRNTDALSLGAMIRRCNRCVFLHLKQPLLDRAISNSTIPSGPGLPASFMLDNFKALSSRDNGDKDPSTSQCCFVQAFKQLNAKDPQVYRHIFNGDRVFQITFEGESGIDAGGVFREGVTRIVEDLFSEHLDLLILCPNGQHVVHTNLDKYVPNPSHTGPLALSMFDFMGKLMGMSLRAKLCLSFEFPSIIWKLLIGEEVSIEDLMAIDAITCKLLHAMRNCEEDGVLDQETFVAKYEDKLRFVYSGSDGVERELSRGGRERLVTYANRLEYCDQVLAARLSEFDRQVAAIARGLSAVVPMRIIQLFSWQQLASLVSGSPTFDMDLWKSRTDSSGVPAKTFALFWRVMESLNPKEQAGFVRFAWGRSRLPAAKDFNTRMKLTSAGRAKLPVAHTCFFSVELPDYATEEEMRHGLLTAIHFGASGVLLG